MESGSQSSSFELEKWEMIKTQKAPPRGPGYAALDELVGECLHCGYVSPPCVRTQYVKRYLISHRSKCDKQ